MNTTGRAIILIDVQEEYFAGPLAIQYPHKETSEANIYTVLETAKTQQLPVALIRHELPQTAPVFAKDSFGGQNRPGIEDMRESSWFISTKQVSSALNDAQLVQWLRDQKVNTLTLIGYMTNNCLLATAAHAELLGFAVEVISDASGAIHLKNSAGEVSAQQVHETLMVLLSSNWAAVGSTASWKQSLSTQNPLASSDLGSSALAGAQVFGDQSAMSS